MSLPGRWRKCDRPWFCDARKEPKRASHIDPPASPYAITRRVRPYRGENNGYPARIFTESFDPKLENKIGIVATNNAVSASGGLLGSRFGAPNCRKDRL
jgi:hypothetical protein